MAEIRKDALKFEVQEEVAALGTRTKVIGVGVAEPDTVSWNVDVANLANAVTERLGSDLRLTPEEIECPMDWMGPR